MPVFEVSQTDPLPGTQPVPLGPPAQSIEGDSHAHMVAPLQELARVPSRSLDRRLGRERGLDAIREYAETIDAIARRIEAVHAGETTSGGEYQIAVEAA